MSLGYSIAVTLAAPFSSDSIKTVLSRGAKLGFIYRAYVIGDLNHYSNPLSVEDALLSIYEGHQEVYMYCITVEFDHSYFNLNFLEDRGEFMVMIPGLNDLWSKVYTNNDIRDIDVARYLEIFLEVTQDYYPLDIQVEHDKWELNI